MQYLLQAKEIQKLWYTIDQAPINRSNYLCIPEEN